MADTEKPTISATPDKKPTHWWWRDDDYVANDTWNWLAVGEVVVAFSLYYWLASVSPWPWLTVLSFISVPLLLLRSEASIQRGIDLLIMDTIQSIENKEFTKAVKCVIFITSLLSSSIISYCITSHLTPLFAASHSGWLLFCLSILSGIFVAATGIAGSIVITSTIAGTAAATQTVNVAANVAFIGAGMGAWPIISATSGVAIGAVALSLFAANWRQLVIIPSLVLGLCTRGIYLRIRATCTLSHFEAGLLAFSHNWFETVLVSNIRHAPALIPRAGMVVPKFNAAFFEISEGVNIVSKSLNIVLKVALIATATIYRWNIKANSWIWAPLALILRPIKWEKHPLTPELAPDTRRTDSAFWSERQMLYTLGVIFGILLAYLIYPHIPQDIQKQLPTWTEIFIKYIPPNLQSFRYWLAVFLLLALSYQIFCAYKMHSSYKEQLAKSKEHQTMSADVEERFDIAAKRLVRSRWLTFACFLLLVYAIVFKYFLTNWTIQAKHLIWDWLKPLL
jgi:hypothetical protein